MENFPLDEHKVNTLREKRMKEIKLFRMIRDVIFQLIFLTILYIVAYSNRDFHSFSYNHSLRRNLLDLTTQQGLDFSHVKYLNHFFFHKT